MVCDSCITTCVCLSVALLLLPSVCLICVDCSCFQARCTHDLLTANHIVVVTTVRMCFVSRNHTGCHRTRMGSISCKVTICVGLSVQFPGQSRFLTTYPRKKSQFSRYAHLSHFWLSVADLSQFAHLQPYTYASVAKN